jgi:Flp pilus assembly protein TadD
MPATAPSRNDPCPCGSGKKYKKCCLVKGSPDGQDASDSRPMALVLQEAIAHHKAGRLDLAIRCYRQVVDRQPKDASALFYLGQALGQCHRRPEGIVFLRRAITANPRKSLYHANLAALLLKEGEADDSLRHAERAIELDPGDVVAHATAAGCHERMNRIDEAIAAIERALAIDPDDPDSILTLAGLLRRRERYEEARDHLVRFVSRALPPEYLHQAWKELAVVLDKLKDYDDAFDALVRGGAECARTHAAQRVDRDAARRRVADYRARLTPEMLARWPRQVIDDDLPAPGFLVGFPRSGTTMTEQVLAAHPNIVTADERPFVRQVKDAMSSMLGEETSVAAMLGRLELDQVRELRRLYWELAAKEMGPVVHTNTFVDKLPLHLIEVGLLSVLFPDARVIVALRDPRDVCLSCFTQRFGLNSAMINFLWWERTAEFYADVMGLWLHVRPWVAFEHIEVRYEDTVGDLERQARRILDHLGVPWRDDVLSFHEQARKKFISTPSYAAVTEPVHRRAMERWRNYPGPMADVAHHLAPFIEAFGYEA